MSNRFGFLIAHLYMWALLVFLGEMITASLNLMFACELKPQGEIEFGWLLRPCSGYWVRSSSRTRTRSRSLLRRGYTGLCPTTRSATDCSTYQAVNPRKTACTKRPFEVVSVL